MTNYKQALKQQIVEKCGEPATLDELAHTCIKMIETYDNVVQPRDRRRKRLPPEYIKVVGFSWELTYGEVSNSHSCPIDGVTNWGKRKEDEPTSYKGWNGRVWVRYGSAVNSFGSDPLRNTLTYTGTGGIGGYSGPWENLGSIVYNLWRRKIDLKYPTPVCYSWDYRIFASDWPIIADVFEKQVMWAELRNEPAPYLRHKFLWEDPVVKAADDEFINLYNLHVKAQT